MLTPHWTKIDACIHIAKQAHNGRFMPPPMPLTKPPGLLADAGILQQCLDFDAASEEHDNQEAPCKENDDKTETGNHDTQEKCEDYKEVDAEHKTELEQSEAKEGANEEKSRGDVDNNFDEHEPSLHNVKVYTDTGVQHMSLTTAEHSTLRFQGRLDETPSWTLDGEFAKDCGR
ncbi:unnamed protein product [Polarella glacialis]|uniref:Uncharacterized protein n=1 Tax=Polarella glacialis TaxID=89957 RepID=A0A813HKW5_POLGL|nr:unnamed protein product [Polarella glacialis]CAE8699922.1 unnamed protein product [Polarella glacialis]